MDTSPVVVAVMIGLIGFALFRAGRGYQRMVDLWASWRATVAAVPIARRAAFAGVWTMVKTGGLAVAAVVVAAALARLI